MESYTEDENRDQVDSLRTQKKEHEVMMSKLKAIKSVRSIANIPKVDSIQEDQFSFEHDQNSSISIMIENELNDKQSSKSVA